MSEGVSEPVQGGPPSPAARAARPARSRPWPVALAAGVIAAALTWGAGEASLGFFPQKPMSDPMAGGGVDLAGFNRVVVKNATLAYGLQGGPACCTLGLAGAIAGRSPRAAAGAGLAGLILGGGLAAAASFGAFTAYHALVDANAQDLLPSLLAHAGAWSVVGAIGGGAFGLGVGGRGGVAHATMGGLAGAAIAALVYEVAGTAVFPLDKTGDPVAESGAARLLAHALVDVLAALGAGLSAESSARSPS